MRMTVHERGHISNYMHACSCTCMFDFIVSCPMLIHYIWTCTTNAHMYSYDIRIVKIGTHMIIVLYVYAKMTHNRKYK